MLTLEQILAPKSQFSTVEIIEHLQTLEVALSRKLKKIVRLQQINKIYKPCDLGVIVLKKFESVSGLLG